jgi:hypothetical protein
MIETMKFEGPLHVVCQCDKCKIEKQESVTKYIGDFLGFKLFAEQDMPKKSIEHMEKKLNSSLELFDIPVGYQYSPFRKPWVELTNDEIDQGLLHSNYALITAGVWRDGVEWAIKQLKEKNNG